MYKINYFNFAAAAVLAVILFSALYRKIGKGSANKTFLIVVAEFLLTTLMDIGSVMLDNAGAGNIIGKYFFHSSYLFLHTVSSLFYLLYLISLTDTWQRLFRRKYRFALIVVPGLLYFCIVILNLFGAVDLIHFNEMDAYTRGTWFVSGYIVGAFYMILGIVYIVRNRGLFSVKWILTLFAPYPFIVAAMIIQLVQPMIIIEMFFNALAILFVYTNIQRPEELMDPITHLSNAKAFEDYSRRSFYNRNRASVILIDIQNFDVVHDIFGLDNLRDFLKECADTILSVSGKLKIKTKAYAGEHGRFFVFVDPRYNDKLDSFAQELSTRFDDNNFSRITELQPVFAFCVISIPKDISSFPDFIRFTSGSFSELKSGKVYYAAEMFQDKYYRILLNINNIVSDALKYDRYEVYYQPIYSCRLKRFVSAEALLRLKDPEYGFVSPDLFIPAAERSGLIQQISDFVLKNVCDFIADDNFKKLGIEYIEVNLSAIECVQANLKERITSIVRNAGISFSQIALEITETALVYETKKLEENLRELSKIGIRFCLDDYGSGYSNTRRIVDLPLSIIKLDKSFLDGIERKINEVIVQDTIKMITNIGDHVVAEGVETEEVLRLLEKQGCDLIQGYYFSKPLPRKEFEALCLNQANKQNSLIS